MIRATFKQNNQNQPSLFPFDFGDLIDQDHPVRIVNQVIDGLDISGIISTYPGGGASSYHPRMMIKVLIYAYLNNIYTSRKIAKALKENVHFIWLSGQQFPDFRTINWFRGKKLKTQIDDIFKQVVLMLQGAGLVSLEEVFTDGTKIESVANRYTFVWKKSVEKFKEKLETKIKAVLKEIDLAIQEDKESIEKEQKEEKVKIDSGELHNKIKEINQRLSLGKAVSKKIKKNIKDLTDKSLPKLMEYELHLSILDGRNSYSKTDHQATFMRMKDDHMKNGQLKPAYNLQLSTENNFITNYTIHQTPGDTITYQEHLGSFKDKYGRYPKRAIADAGYGGLENYDFLSKYDIDNYVKYNYFHKEQTKKFKTDISKVENLFYNQEEDYYICPMGQKMRPLKQGQRNTSTGYEYEVTIYKAQNCSNCPLRGACHKQKEDRQIEINKRLIAHKQIVRENLTSEEGIKLRGRRNSEVEQTFGQLKWNKKFNRLLLKGLAKTNIEIGLLAIAHNMQKLHKSLFTSLIDVFSVFHIIIKSLLQKKKIIYKKKKRTVKIFSSQKIKFYQTHVVGKYNQKAA
jgi:transposase